MKQFLKKAIIILTLAMMLTGVVGTNVSVYAKTAVSSHKKKKKVNYKKRAVKAKKNLYKKVKKQFKRWKIRVVKTKRKGRYLTCTLNGSLGCMGAFGKVRVDLKTGMVTILESSELFDDYEIYRYDDDDDEEIVIYRKFKIKVK